MDVLVGTNKSACKDHFYAEFGKQFEQPLKLNTCILYTGFSTV